MFTSFTHLQSRDKTRIDNDKCNKQHLDLWIIIHVHSNKKNEIFESK